MKFILARKLNMTQLFSEDGKAIPVTVLEISPNKVSAVKTKDRDGYEAVQIEMALRPGSGQGKKREFRITNHESRITEGQELKVSQFEPGEVINVTGISKGRGFAGAVKRHGFHGAPASHGHDHPRAVGSIGQRFPQHVRPGLRMAGHMGAAKSTVKNSVVVAVEPAKNLLFVKGGVPGAPGGFLKIATTGKKMEIAKIAEYGKTEKPETEKPEEANEPR